MTTKPTRMNLGPDPLDPHGDGSIRDGDPLYALLMSGDVVHAERATDDGDWDVVATPAPPANTPAVARIMGYAEFTVRPLPWWRRTWARITGRR